MKLRNFVHKGLKRLYEGGSAKGLLPMSVEKLQDMLTFPEAMADAEELRRVPTWKAHLSTGNRKGEWSLGVTRNWRLTFWIDETGPTICDVNLEDYHQERTQCRSRIHLIPADLLEDRFSNRLG